MIMDDSLFLNDFCCCFFVVVVFFFCAAFTAPDGVFSSTREMMFEKSVLVVSKTEDMYYW